MGREGAGCRQVVVRFIALVVALAIVNVPARAEQAPDRDELMARVGAYITRFITQFTNVVAEEDYVQETTSPRRKRHLRSDFLLVRYPGATLWQAFRDTFEVDGKAVRTEPERLTQLFVDPPANAMQRVREIAETSAKYNLENIGTINYPLIVIALLQRGYHDRFRFTRSVMEKSLGPDVRTVQYEEFRRPTILTRDGNGDLFSSGLIWVEQETGRVVKTQLRFGRTPYQTRIETTFKLDADLGIDVPTEMRESYPARGGEVNGVATYGRFRRFQVQTTDTVN